MALKKISMDTTNRICALVVGPAGIGKTSLLRTIFGQQFNSKTGQWEQISEPAGKVCTLSAESGLLCVRDLIASGQVEGFEIGTFQDMREVHAALMSPEFRQRYQWIYIDSLTEISARCVEAVKLKYPSARDSFPMWGEYNDSMTALIKAFRDLTSYNVIFTCLETVDKDQNGFRFKGPMISGTSLKERLTSYFDEVFYMERCKNDSGEENVVFKTREPVGLAKDRSGKLDPEEPANLLTIQKRILA
ncbi:AAA family ATPase [Mailhella sp.]|uniref:AAA family ATPase n=1 Tax=Mailhella sp. TaxID=1981029 RepID=UPI003AB278F4